MLQTTSSGDHSPAKNVSETEESCLTKYRTGNGINDITDELNIAVSRDATAGSETFGFAPISPHCHYHSPLKTGEDGQIQNDGKKLKSQISKLTDEVISGNLSKLVIVVFGTGHLETELALLKLDNFNNQKAEPAAKLLNHVCMDVNETVTVAGFDKEAQTEFTIARLKDEENATAAAISAHIHELGLAEEYSDKIEVYTWEKFKTAYHSAYLESVSTRDDLLLPDRKPSNGREAEQEGGRPTLQEQVSHTAENYLHGLAGGSTKSRNTKGNRKKSSTKGDSGLRAKLVQELYANADSTADTVLQKAHQQTIAAIEDDIQTYIKNELILFIMFKIAFNTPGDRHLVFYPGAANHAVRHTCDELLMTYVHLNISTKKTPTQTINPEARSSTEAHRETEQEYESSLLQVIMNIQLQVFRKIGNMQKNQKEKHTWLTDEAKHEAVSKTVYYLDGFRKNLESSLAAAYADDTPNGIEDLESSSSRQSGIDDLGLGPCDLIASIGAVLYASTQAALDIEDKENKIAVTSTLSTQLKDNSAKFCLAVAQEYKKMLENGQRALREADKRTLQIMQEQIKALFSSTLEESVHHAHSVCAQTSNRASDKFTADLVNMLDQCDAILSSRSSSLQRSNSVSNLPATDPVDLSANYAKSLSSTGIFANTTDTTNLVEEQPTTTSSGSPTGAH